MVDGEDTEIERERMSECVLMYYVCIRVVIGPERLTYVRFWCAAF